MIPRFAAQFSIAVSSLLVVACSQETWDEPSSTSDQAALSVSQCANIGYPPSFVVTSSVPAPQCAPTFLETRTSDLYPGMAICSHSRTPPGWAVVARTFNAPDCPSLVRNVIEPVRNGMIACADSIPSGYVATGQVPDFGRCSPTMPYVVEVPYPGIGMCGNFSPPPRWVQVGVRISADCGGLAEWILNPG